MVGGLLYMWFLSSMDLSAKLVWSGMSFGLYVWAMWIDTLLLLGVRSILAVPSMALLFGKSKKGSTLLGIIVISLVFWWSPFAIEPSSYRLEMTIGLITSIMLLWLQPPAVLILAKSSQETADLVRMVSMAVHPLRVVALLDTKRTGRDMGTFSLFTDNIRTDSDREWQKVVDILLESVPAVILDTRTESPPVSHEVAKIINSQRLKQTLFIVGPLGEAPALENNGYKSDSFGVYAVIKEDLTRDRIRELFH